MKRKIRWIVKNKIEGDFSLEKMINLVLKNRGIENLEEFLAPEITQIPSFKKLFDSKGAAKKIVQSIKKKKKIVIYGDYDVDGICGCCLLWTFLYFELCDFLNLEKKDLQILPYIPDRVDEGYGLSTKSLDKLSSEGVDLIITVDCGVRDKEIMAKYENIDFIVTDHHLSPENILKNYKAILVHQLYPKKEYPFDVVCGSFVVFLLVLAIKDLVGMDSSFEANKKYLDLVALPTVTDIMPLYGVNRILVKEGLDIIRSSARVGLKQLTQKSGFDLKNTATYHLGYVLGPRLNASGRIGSAMDGLRLLATKDELQAEQLASKLDRLNFERQKLTDEILNQAREKIMKEKLQSLIFVVGKNWNEGIIGLVAGKLQEEFNQPVIVVTEDKNGIKGSARSINGFNITEAIEKFEKYLVKFGGHSQAAGFSVQKGKLDDFKKLIVDYVEENIDKRLLDKIMEIDMVLDIENLNMELASELMKLEPYGYGNRRPLFFLKKVRIVSKRILGKGQNHMKLEIEGRNGEMVEAIFFNCFENIEKINEQDIIDIVGYVGINEWNGSTKVQFEIKDCRTCNESS